MKTAWIGKKSHHIFTSMHLSKPSDHRTEQTWTIRPHYIATCRPHSRTSSRLKPTYSVKNDINSYFIFWLLGKKVSRLLLHQQQLTQIHNCFYRTANVKLAKLFTIRCDAVAENPAHLASIRNECSHFNFKQLEKMNNEIVIKYSWVEKKKNKQIIIMIISENKNTNSENSLQADNEGRHVLTKYSRIYS